jgi:hypothetical protein
MDEWRDFTYDPVNFPASEVATFVNYLRDLDRQYVPIIDPGILVPNPLANQSDYFALSDGLNQRVFVRDGFSELYPLNDTITPNITGYYLSQVSFLLSSSFPFSFFSLLIFTHTFRCGLEPRWPLIGSVQMPRHTGPRCCR